MAFTRWASSQSRWLTGFGLPLVEGLSAEAEHPAGHRDREPLGGKVKDQRELHFGRASLAK